MKEENKNYIIIAKTQFRSISSDGSLAKTILHIQEDGATYVTQLSLRESGYELKIGETLLRNFKNKMLTHKLMGLKLESLMKIVNVV